jgi:hypothetical protein
MDRIALSNSIKELSGVFACDNTIAVDLNAMAHVIENMSDEKFASVVNKEAFGQMFNNPGPKAGPAKMQEIRQRMRETGTPGTIRTPEEFAQMAVKVFGEGNLKKPGFIQKLVSELKGIAKEPEMADVPTGEGIPTPVTADNHNEDVMDGMYWNKEASDAVAGALLKDVVGMDKSICCDTGRKLEKKEMPDSEKKQETPSTLKGEQIPQDKENHDSGIVEKANAAKKQASDEEHEEKEADAIKDIKDGIEKIEEAVEKIEEVEEKKEDEEVVEAKEEKKDEKKEDEEVDAGKKKTAASVVDDSLLKSEGVELIAPMSEAKLSSNDESELSKLFD